MQFQTIHNLLLLICILTGIKNANSNTNENIEGKNDNREQSLVADKHGNITTDPTIETTTKDDTKLLLEKLQNIAYYLRNYKFNEYDRRYETDPTNASRPYYKFFPKPPLRSLHWEVHQFCEPSFHDCVEYLSKKLHHVALRRSDDTSVVMLEQRWSWRKNEQQIVQVDAECLRNKRIDDTVADHFEGPLERFQWRVTASYYMCWYTLLKTPEMRRLYEKCDNFASCLDYDYGPRNEDDRVEDWRPFSCALYSFCPDPCCPFKHLTNLKDCWDSPENPCYRLNPKKKRTCEFNKTANINFKCICKWGFIRDIQTENCLPSNALSAIKLSRRKQLNITEELTVWQRIKNVILFKKNSAQWIKSQIGLILLIILNAICNIN
ncbi:uncharacterized protein LOC126886773 isoform X2 [Diabrotica virgifera virgifera]|uniref:Uncharacterized protein n=1 Tax=Diabrotica virgifera virgifera TaxID=50390 RepID=A0ABM5KI11_DIAVI|nr:uncharacterized protein LOC126886773 isoform X2 [Diabrotica virgifera virgifera]